MNNAVYDTTFGRLSANIVAEVRDFTIRAVMRRSDELVELSPGLYKIHPEITTSEVKPFRLPISAEYNGKTYTVVDLRQFEDAFGKIRQVPEMRNAIRRGNIEKLWLEEPEAYEAIIPELSVVFAEWMVQAVKGRYQTTVPQQEQIRLFLASYYRLTLYSQESLERLSENDIEEILFRFVGRNFRLQNEFINAVMQSEEYRQAITNIAELKDNDLNMWLTQLNLFLATPAIRLDAGALLQLVIRSSWMGTSAHDIVGVSVEHPPMLAYMVDTALLVGTFRRTKLGAAVESAKRGNSKINGISDFLRDFNLSVKNS